MTYREKYFELKNQTNKYLNNTAIKTILMDDGGFADFTQLIKNFDSEIKNLDKLNDNVKGEPLQYVLGYAYFVNSNYFVDENVLIPRQETEELAVYTMTQIVKQFGRDAAITILDVGTGSGILAIYLKEYFPNSKVIATDISEKCLQIARKNAENHKVSIDFRLGDMLEPIKEKVDVIISNPPYIGSPESVDPQTLKYEPHLALFAEPKTKYYEIILSHLDIMKKKFFIAFEIGEDMEEELTEILERDYKGIGYKFMTDIYGKTRFLYIVRDNWKIYEA